MKKEIAFQKPSEEPKELRSPEWWKWWQEEAKPGFFLHEGIIVEKDIPIKMRDEIKLAANVYRPDKPGKFPVIIGITFFGKDIPWSEIHSGWGIAYDTSSPTLTRTTAFEAPDPAFWVPHGYVVVLVDQRGTGRSGGQPFTPFGHDAHMFNYLDYYDVIEWAGIQEWSNGNVGLSGVSTFAMAQWAVASLNPPHLKAINPWEGFTSSPARQPLEGERGCIPETVFLNRHLGRNSPPHNPAFPDPEKNIVPPPWRGSYEYLEDIIIPALVCGTWSDHFCHTRGTMGGVFLAYQKISSKNKWLYTHGRQKWAEYYSSEALSIQKMFFDCFLKGTDSRILEMPKVRLEVRDTIDRWLVRFEKEWPLMHTKYTKLYLDAKTNTLNFNRIKNEAIVSYDSELTDGKVLFNIIFEEDTELTGYMKLKLWVSPEEADDMDLFVTVRKFDVNKNEILFDGWAFPSTYPVAFGLLRLSNREIDEEKSTPWQPFLTYKKVQKVEPGEIVSCEIEIFASSTLFHKGETLGLEISGKFQGKTERYGFKDLNKGKHSIYTGGKYDSYLLVPLIPNSHS